jgi:transcriptional regulator with XRE-family HTH domain
MTEKDVVRKAMAMRGWSQPKLATEAGFKSQSNITGLLNNNKNGIRMDNLFRMLDAMGFEIIVKDKMGSNKEFVIDMKEEEI